MVLAASSTVLEKYLIFCKEKQSDDFD